MPRIARIHYPGKVVHIIARFVNREFRIADDEIRHEYLRRLGASASRCDVAMLGYALMSSHVHLAAVAGQCATRELIHPVHSGFGTWLNRRQDRLGPVFAERFRTVWMDLAHAPSLLAYIHNNPVRAEVAPRAAESTWSSHRTYVGLEAAPPWLDVTQGLALSGLSTTSADRESFDRLVLDRSRDPRDPTVTGEGMADALSAARQAAGGPVELGSASISSTGVCFPVVAPTLVRIPLRTATPEPSQVLEVVARAAAVSPEQLLSPQRTRPVTNARRLALLTWAYLRGPRVQMARALGISSPAATQLISRDPERLAELAPLAKHLANQLRSETE